LQIGDGRIRSEKALSTTDSVSITTRSKPDPRVSHHFDLYVSTSKDMRSVLAEYDPNLAMASLDEGYLKYVRSSKRADK
jgi:nucleotidyltransferase/DNA polymerase involved in DNA repair